MFREEGKIKRLQCVKRRKFAETQGTRLGFSLGLLDLLFGDNSR